MRMDNNIFIFFVHHVQIIGGINGTNKNVSEILSELKTSMIQLLNRNPNDQAVEEIEEVHDTKVRNLKEQKWY